MSCVFHLVALAVLWWLWLFICASQVHLLHPVFDPQLSCLRKLINLSFCTSMQSFSQICDNQVPLYSDLWTHFAPWYPLKSSTMPPNKASKFLCTQERDLVAYPVKMDFCIWDHLLVHWRIFWSSLKQAAFIKPLFSTICQFFLHVFWTVTINHYVSSV